MLTERFLRYAADNTQSDGSAGQVPSTPGQLELAVCCLESWKTWGLRMSMLMSTPL